MFVLLHLSCVTVQVYAEAGGLPCSDLLPVAALVWALAGVFDNNFGRAPGGVPAVLAAVLGVACLALLVRLVVLAAHVACPPETRRGASVDVTGRLNGGFSQ